MTAASSAPEQISAVPTRLGTLHVRVIGEGRPCVLWPSMFVDSHTWDQLLGHLAEDRRYLLVDGPGLGLSEPLRRESNIDEAADAATDLLDGLAIAEPVDWVGNAFGGHVGFKLAIRRGVLRSLVAISAPTEPIAPALRRRIVMLRPLLRAFGPVGPVRGAILDAMLTERSQGDPALCRVVLDSLARPDRASLSAALESFILNRADVNHELSDIAVPSLFIASDDRGDWSPEDAAAAAARTKGARVETVGGARTLVPLEQPEAVAALLNGFWDSLRD
ncbi:alpha/beta hydrolase [Nocardioides sp. cx-169]|uniref:alpha/beta fold hydrolase n=1 Tax=Nocardioides sp. cx-169 TaxID=2899080 RepID=UPI001E3AAA83|nr:alpha/beta hydrolase [Nocardioides sp. cx-169]MCD4532829.1 alpha/beta hydrolase [Nocardioides sp. cx-169]